MTEHQRFGDRLRDRLHGDDDPGSDERMGPERMERIRRRLDLELAAVAEEERKTAAQPTEDAG